MTKKLTWRLSKLPTPDEVRELVKDKIITQEEAREILLNEEDVDERSKESLEKEIKFLKELVDKLSNNNKSIIIEKIKEVEVPYRRWDFYYPYQEWTSGITTAIPLTGGTSVNCSFSDINTLS